MLKKMIKGSFIGALLLTITNTYALEIHEWGTFTSLVNERGELMSGMHHEEVGLPGFVYGLRSEGVSGALNQKLNCDHPHSKCAFPSPTDPLRDIIPFNEFNTKVTQKMETPVIYFYGNVDQKVHVEVGFPGGMISQWYPAASSFNNHLDEFKNGFMNWDITLKSASDTKAYPKTLKSSIWNPARETAANTIQVNGEEEERFIFYRGLGDFEVPLKIKLRNSEITITNTSDQIVPALFYLQTSKALGVKKFLALPSLGAHESKTFATSDARLVKGANSPIQKALEAQGLFEDEARSMLRTWDSSYFHTEGERLLYLLPQAWTETILPMKLNPVPEKLVRVLVGRIELFSKEAQAALKQDLKNKINLSEDRLLEAKINALNVR